jgi:hypothetical protein
MSFMHASKDKFSSGGDAEQGRIFSGRLPTRSFPDLAPLMKSGSAAISSTTAKPVMTSAAGRSGEAVASGSVQKKYASATAEHTEENRIAILERAMAWGREGQLKAARLKYDKEIS